MTDHYHPHTHPTARKQHRCIACYTMIAPGEEYVQQTGYYEGKAFRNRYHAQCWDTLSAEGTFEFTPGELEAPTP
jgi:hypothetical protein